MDADLPRTEIVAVAPVRMEEFARFTRRVSLIERLTAAGWSEHEAEDRTDVILRAQDNLFFYESDEVAL